MYIPIILGTAREGRQSEKVANFVLKETIANNFESEILDVRDYILQVVKDREELLPLKELEEKILKADALIIVSPEYNHSYPGELKMMLDLFYKQYFYKPVGICGVSSGSFGGARMIKHLQQVCTALHMLPIGESLYFSKVQELFDDNGRIQDEKYKERIIKFLDELTVVAKNSQ